MKDYIVFAVLVVAAFVAGAYTERRSETMAAAQLTEWTPTPKAWMQYCAGAYVWMQDSRKNASPVQVWENVDGVALPMLCD